MAEEFMRIFIGHKKLQQLDLEELAADTHQVIMKYRVVDQPNTRYSKKARL